MLLTLQCNDHFEEFSEFDPLTGAWHSYTKTNDPSKWKSKVDGWYATIGGHKIVLYRFDHQLFLEHEGRTYPITNDVYASLEAYPDLGEDGREFKLWKGSKLILSVRYKKPIYESEWDFTYTEPEDFDFFLFVRNILRDPRRRRRNTVGHPLED